MQKVAVERRMRADGFDPEDAEVYFEKASGKTADRKAYLSLLESCRRGRVDRIYVYRLDRIGRSMMHLLNFLQEMQAKSIRVISVADNIDTLDESPMGEAMRHMMGVFAQLEGRMISDRVKAGLSAARANGKRLGRPPVDRNRIKKLTKKARELLERSPGATADEVQKHLRCNMKLAREIRKDIRLSMGIKPGQCYLDVYEVVPRGE